MTTTKKHTSAYSEEQKNRVIVDARQVIADGENTRGWIGRLARQYQISYNTVDKWLQDAGMSRDDAPKLPPTPAGEALKEVMEKEPSVRPKKSNGNGTLRPPLVAQRGLTEQELLAVVGELYLENLLLKRKLEL